MRICLLMALSLCLFTIGYCPAPGSTVAQDAPKSKATERRPINDQMTLDEARDAVNQAARGDREALQKLKEGRLAYLPVLLRDRRTRDLANSLLIDEIDWVRDMQRWETVVQGIDTALMESTYQELKDRFHDAEAQLARIVIETYKRGDMEAFKRVVALKPKSPWVLAARAWVGDISDAQQRVDLLLDILPLSIEESLWCLPITPANLDEDARDYKYGSDDYLDAALAINRTLDGVPNLNAIPFDWGLGNTFEMLGVLTYDLPRKKREAVAAKVAEITGDEKRQGSRFGSFAYAAFFGEKEGEFDVNFLWLLYSHGVQAMNYALNKLKDQDLARRLTSIAAFWGTPEWAPAQDFLLDEALATNDDQFARLAIRVVLTVNDDSLRAVNSVARALAKHKRLADERKAFATALKATKNSQLAQIAAKLTGSGKLPPDLGNPRMKLSQANRAALLGAFMHPDEIKCYGGPEPAYLMARSQSLFAQHRVHIAMDYAAQSIELVAKTNKRRSGQTNAYLTHRTLRYFLGRRGVAEWLAPWKKQYPVAVEILLNNVKLWDNPTDDIESAVYAVERQVTGGASATEEQLNALAKDHTLAGGYGLHLAALVESNRGTRVELMKASERVTPSDFHTYYQKLPFSDLFGRFHARDWSVAEHLSLCLAMLQPYSWNTLSKLASLPAKAGADPRGLSPLFMQAANHPIQPYLGGGHVRGLEKLLFVRPSVAMLLQMNGAAHGDIMPEGWVPAFDVAMKRSYWGHEYWTSLELGTFLSNRKGFTRANFDYEYNVRPRDNVSILLDYALELQGVDPESAIRLVEQAESIGVSDYGYFVGSQSYIRAKAQLGEYGEAKKRWEELRDGDVGFPPYLDRMLLHGLAEGNQHAHVGDALDQILKYEQDMDSGYLTYGLRRALMAAGRHSKVAGVTPPQWKLNSYDTFTMGNYTEVFFEARSLLQAGKLGEIVERANALWTGGAEAEIGVLLDSILLRCLAEKLNPATAAKCQPDAKGMLHALSTPDFHWFRPSTTLDYTVLEVLVGERVYTDVPAISKDATWHGLLYAERPQGYKGSGFLTEGEALARDHYIRGLLAFFADKPKDARKQLKDCVAANQRFSYEYHVAEWLLDTQLSK